MADIQPTLKAIDETHRFHPVTHLTINGVDVSEHVRSIDLSSTHVPHEPEFWESFTRGLEPFSMTFEATFDAEDDPFAASWEWVAWVKRQRMGKLHCAYRSRLLSRRRRAR
jgi:hypothetical protein